MAIRNIRIVGDEILTKPSRDVEKIDERIKTILDDMKDTMYEYDGVGLAAPQIGILRKLVVMDVGDGIIEFINPEIVESSGEQTDEEGCLSVPGKRGEVTRPMKVTVKAQNREGKWMLFEGDGLFARCACHEIDHLYGKLFLSKATKITDLEEN